MKVQNMAHVAEAVRQRRFDHDTDLPLPNVYWCTVTLPDRKKIHTHLADYHTKAVVAKLADWCERHKGSRPYRSNSQVRVRRLKLCDVIQTPDAYQVALHNARVAGEEELVVALRLLPAWILQHIDNLERAANEEQAEGIEEVRQ